RLSRPPNHLSAPFFSSSLPRPPRPPLFPYTTLFRSGRRAVAAGPATTEETTMTRFIRLGWVAIVAAWLAACGGSSGPERGSLVEPAAAGYVATLSAAQIDAATSSNGLQALTGPARCDVEFVSLTYRTPGAGDGGPAPLLAYTRGTDVSRPRAMANPQDAEAFLLAAMYAAQGYAVVATDYLGYNRSNYPFHPYLHADSEASSVIDSIRAARNAAEELGVPLTGEVMLSGYSQGGHASMAAHRAIERDFAGEIGVVAGAHLAGPYNMSGSFKDADLDNPIAGYQFFVPF